ncbi:MAG TPA: hypothetical protein VFR66_18160 [Burkholderiales bacterium]|nr:hypothetical protein [Burkholderiales bacterium]
MSPLWPERLSVALEPLPPEEPQPWQGAVEDFARKIAALRKRVDVTVVLSNHFVRYAVLPEHDGATTPEEELALARFHFTKIHGDRVKGWEVRVFQRLACAIDAALLEGIKKAFPGKGKAKLISVQPRLMAAYNAARGRIPREGAWLLLGEPGRTCLARVATRGWASVHNGRETDAEELLERERSRAGGEPLPSLVLTL